MALSQNGAAQQPQALTLSCHVTLRGPFPLRTARSFLINEVPKTLFAPGILRLRVSRQSVLGHPPGSEAWEACGHPAGMLCPCLGLQTSAFFWAGLPNWRADILPVAWGDPKQVELVNAI